MKGANPRRDNAARVWVLTALWECPAQPRGAPGSRLEAAPGAPGVPTSLWIRGVTGTESKRWPERIKMENNFHLPVNYSIAITWVNLGFPGWKANLVLGTKRLLFSTSLQQHLLLPQTRASELS